MDVVDELVEEKLHVVKEQRRRVVRRYTCRCGAQGVPAQAYLSWAFERLGTHRHVFDLPLEAMTPAAFKKTLG